MHVEQDTMTNTQNLKLITVKTDQGREVDEPAVKKKKPEKVLAALQ